MAGWFFLSGPFVLLGSAMAALITYREMCHHLPPREALKVAAKTGLGALLVFVVLSFFAIRSFCSGSP